MTHHCYREVPGITNEDDPTREDNLIAAIYDLITSDVSVAKALEIWRFPYATEPDDSRRMWLVLQHVTAVAIEEALHCLRSGEI